MAKRPEAPIDRTFSALADPIRRQVLQRLKEAPGLSVTDLTSTLPIKMPGLMKHLDVLSDAGLISRTKIGRTVSLSLTAEPLQQAAAWLLDYEDFWSGALDRLAEFAERETNR